MKQAGKTALRSLLIFLEIFVALFILYFSIAFWLIMIPVNTEFENNGPHEVWVMSNGLHTDICVPIEHDLMNWSEVLNTGDLSQGYNWVAFGWGDRDVYLHTPTWAETNPAHVFNSLFLPTESLIHATFRVTPPENLHAVRLRLTDDQYLAIVNELTARLKISDGKATHVRGFSYGRDDRFYLAEHDYHMFRTCNNWTNEILKKAGVRTAVWAPIQAGVFYQLNMIAER